MAVRDVPMSGTVDVDELPDDRDEVDTETFAKRMMKPEPTKPLSVDQTHYTAKSDWSTKQRDADIDDALAARGYALADLDENGEPRGREDDDANMRVSRKPSKAEKAAEKAEARRARAARARDASGKKWFSDQFIRNASIFAGACLGATYEVATMPATVQNFNKAVYATTGYVAESLPRNGLAGKALSNIDFYAMVIDVLSAVAYFAAIVGVAIACVVVVVRMIGIFTGMGESALNFVCIPFTWTYAKRFVDECFARVGVSKARFAPTTTQRLGASLGVTAVVVEAFETVAPVTTRGLCLGLAFSFFATEMMQFAGGFVWIVGLLVATWAARVALRLVLGVVSKVFPPMERLRDAMPAVHVVPGLRKAAEHLGVGAGAALKAGSAAAKAAGAGAARSAKAARKAGSLAKDGVSVGGGAAPPRLSPAPRWAPPWARRRRRPPCTASWPAPRGACARGSPPGTWRSEAPRRRGARSSGRRRSRGAAPGKCARLCASPPCRRRCSWTRWRRARAGRRARGRSGRERAARRGRRSSGCEARVPPRSAVSLFFT